VTDLVGVRDENARLREALVEASLRVTRLEEVERENIRLQAILGFEPPPGYRLLPARVIAVNAGRYPTTLTINRGLNHGVSMNQAVINDQGLVGRVTAAASDFATLQLLTDPTNRVAVRVVDSREMGIVRFSMSGALMVDNVPIQGDIDPGDVVISSGLGGVYPPGLVVGVVDRVDRPEDEPFCRVHLIPAVNFNRLEELFVLRPLVR
jgi:rod shape-determining protein MreC